MTRGGRTADQGGGPPRDVAGLAAWIQASRALRGSVVHHRYLPGCGPVWAGPPAAAHGPGTDELALAAALESAGIRRLYSHQAEALEAAAGGRNVLTVTPTASGKSLIYWLTALRALAADPAARVLLLFPYKALEHDQLSSIRSLLRAAGMEQRIAAAVYDGDTPAAERRRIRAEPPQILITNPDMLHLGLLPYHEEWRPLLANLRLVVVDELHVYRGVFGAHVHHVLRRLARLLRRHGAAPRWIASSATIGNPGSFAEALIGEPFTVVSQSGAPRAGRHVLFVNPSQGSPYTAAVWLLEHCVRAGLRTIAFTKARRITELLATWVGSSAPDLAPRIASYRAGYLSSERRAIESRLASGDLSGVIATSALEHGIDIGGLDVCLLVGYPGSITSSWQRLGRTGRSGGDALVVLIGLPDALDQYFMTSPGEFFDRGFEQAALDPANPEIASQHLVCAAAESPLTESDRSIYPQAFHLVAGLEGTGRLSAGAEGGVWYSLRRAPQRDVSLRSIGAAYAIVEADSGRPIGSVDGLRAFTECHQGAIYLHQGHPFEVVELDLVRRRVTARRVACDHYTQVVSEKETEILEVAASRVLPGFRAGLGRLRVTQEFKEYVRRRIADQQVLSRHPLELPPVIYETVGLWYEIPAALKEIAARDGLHFMGSLHGSEHAAISLFPLLMLCDRGDVGGISYPSHPQTGGAAVFIYDGHPGGIGLAARGYEEIERLLSATAGLIRGCACEQGCPSCIHSPRCGSGNHPLDKHGARVVLEALLSARVPFEGPPLTAGSLRPMAQTAAPAGTASPPGAVPRRPAAGPGPPSAQRELFFDLETRRSAGEVGGWDKIHAMGLALAVVYEESSGAYRTYYEQDVDRLLVDLMSADRVVGFNVKRFDYAVLSGYRNAAFDRIPTCDLLEEIHRILGFRLSLGHLAEVTLGEGKAGDGLQSLRWFKEGRLDLIETYCRKDVEVTRRLYRFGRDNGYLLYRDALRRPLRVPVSW
ncbi:MAG TPA: DEAD/DEAH box helicase [Candidatus Polarisedimenticolia bacterium]|nr:DEAD/DEAH box helicase [Candidatus Polarisedimenticolia bacterium]